MVLHDVSIKLEPARTVTRCGPSGGDKSTLLNRLLRFYDPSESTVILDGIDLRYIRRGNLRSRFALVQ